MTRWWPQPWWQPVLAGVIGGSIGWLLTEAARWTWRVLS